MNITVRQAESSDFAETATLVHALLSELGGPESTPPDLDAIKTSTMQVLGGSEAAWAFLAIKNSGNAVAAWTFA